ncbi:MULTISPECIES: hypothetical protein [unclassified Streptomyces]|uniref:hypothetical protein n=1 Tax=unclassified Streptomyces TaxID=2593676 RepID=UPI0033E05913
MLHSVGVSRSRSPSPPARRTVELLRSIVHSPMCATRREGSSVDRRRSTARSRARSSFIAKGLVT